MILSQNKLQLFSFFLVIFVVFALPACHTPAQNGDTQVFKNVTVVSTIDGSLTANQTVLVSDGYIREIGNSNAVSIPRGAVLVAVGGYLMPGLSEMHAHIPPASQGQQYMEDVLVLYMSQGVTTIRGMLGEAAHLDLRKRVDANELPGPRIFTSGPSFNGRSATTPERGREMVREQVEAGYDLLKFHPGLTVEVFNAVTEEARELGIEFSGHISYDVGLERTLASGKKTIDHLDRYMEYLSGDAALRPDPSIIYFGYDLAFDADPAIIADAARKTREAGVWNVPTNTLLENVFNPDLDIAEMQDWPGMEFIPSSTRSGWVNYVNIIRNQQDYNPEKARTFLNLRASITKALQDEGAGLLLGADAPQIFNPPGYSAHRELALLVEYGLTPLQALQTGTLNVGKYLSEENLTGQVAPGFRADLVLLGSNPLENIEHTTKIEGVMTYGTYYSRSDLDAMLDKVREHHQQREAID